MRKVQVALFSMFRKNKNRSASSNACAARVENRLVDSVSPSKKVKVSEVGEGIGPSNFDLLVSDSESSAHTNGKSENPARIYPRMVRPKDRIIE